MGSSSDTDDDSYMDKFRDAVDTNFISDDMFKEVGSTSKNPISTSTGKKYRTPQIIVHFFENVL